VATAHGDAHSDRFRRERKSPAQRPPTVAGCTKPACVIQHGQLPKPALPRAARTADASCRVAPLPKVAVQKRASDVGAAQRRPDVWGYLPFFAICTLALFEAFAFF
jgi:hypothetical protein